MGWHNVEVGARSKDFSGVCVVLKTIKEEVERVSEGSPHKDSIQKILDMDYIKEQFEEGRMDGCRCRDLMCSIMDVIG